MFDVTCPTLATAHTAGRGDLLSTHRTAAGAIGYARCVCGGLVVLADEGQGWSQAGHAAARTAVAAAGRTTVVAERCA